MLETAYEIYHLYMTLPNMGLFGSLALQSTNYVNDFKSFHRPVTNTAHRLVTNDHYFCFYKFLKFLKRSLFMCLPHFYSKGVNFSFILSLPEIALNTSSTNRETFSLLLVQLSTFLKAPATITLSMYIYLWM